MAYAENWNSLTLAKLQTAKGTPASGTGAVTIPLSGGQMGRLQKAAISSRLVRGDAMQRRGRHGTQKTSGSYSGELPYNFIDDILQSLMRGTFTTANLNITQSSTFNGSAAATSVTTTANTIVAAAGSWITQGLRIGDVIRVSGFPDAANNFINLRIIGLTALVITVDRTLVVNATPDTTFSVVRSGRTLVNPLAGSLVKRYWTIEENDLDLTGSEIYTDVVWNRLRLSMREDSLIETELGWVGTGAMSVNTGSAVLSASDTVMDSVAATEASLRFGATTQIDLTAFDITFEVPANAPSVINPVNVSPDVFLGTFRTSVSLTVLRKDLVPLQQMLAETPLSLHFLAEAQGSTPQPFFSIYVGNFTLGDVAKSAVSTEAGARTVTLTIPPELVGVDLRGGAYDQTMVKFQSAP